MTGQAGMRSQRMDVGREAEAALTVVLEGYGFLVQETGQEHWLLPAIHAAIRNEHDDLMARAVRYTPDVLAYHPRFRLLWWWEVKANKTPGTPNFTVEVASRDEQVARMEKGERVVVAFWERATDKTWWAQWANKLGAGRDMGPVRHEAAGSQTPYLLIYKSSTIPLDDFLRKNGWRP